MGGAIGGGATSAIGGIMAGIGTSFLAGAAGDRRKALLEMANFPGINIDQEMANAVSGNKSILPESKALASDINAFNRDELMKQLRASIPGYDTIVNQQSNLVQSQLKGEIPKDVQNQIARRASERGLFQGTAGSQFARNVEARDIGLTSLDITQRGFSNAMNFLQSTKNLTSAPTFDVTSMFMTPSQRIGIQMSERNTRLNLLSAAYNATTGNEVWGNQLQSVGNAMSGLGMGMMSGSFGGGMPSLGSNGGGSMYLPSPSTFGSGSATMSGGIPTFGSNIGNSYQFSAQ